MTKPLTPPDKQWLIVAAASAGGLEAITGILAALPRDLPAAVVVVLHRTPREQNHLVTLLQRKSALPVRMATGGEQVLPGTVYLARSDSHLVIEKDRRFSYRDGTKIRYVLSSANPLLESAAAAFGSRLIAIVLTGGGSDATDGVQGVKSHGGVVIVQDPTTAAHSGMPTAAIGAGAADYVLPLGEIAPVLQLLTGAPAV